MFKFLKKRLSNEKGAMDTIYLFLGFTIIGVVGVIGISTWFSDNKDTLEKQAIAEIDTILEKDAPASGYHDYHDYELAQNVEEEIILED